MRKLVKGLAWLVVALVLIVAIAAGALYFHAKSAKTDWAGEKTVPGLTGEARLVRDHNAVLHISGTSDADVFFGLGYAHAQDRMFQMDMIRTVISGRLSEWVGSSTAEIDGYIRTIGLYRAAEQSLAHLKPETLAVIEAYTAGVNAYLETASHPVSPEYGFLLTKPRPWTAADTIAMNKAFAVGLCGDATGEINSALLSEVLSAVQLADFQQTHPLSSPVITAGAREIKQPVEFLKSVLAALPARPPEGASNNWVVDGQWTASGKPLLANDPHLGLWGPTTFVLAHLNLSTGNAIGATAPGMPFVVMGRTDHVAWGFTNARGDVQDLFIETIDPDQPDHYVTPNGPKPFSTRTETISVRWGADVEVDIRETHRGPVLPRALADMAGFDNKVVSLAWTALDADDTTLDAGVEIMTAETIDDTLEALKRFIVPQQSIVMADTSGNIGYMAPARIPLRREPAQGWGPLGPGRMPVDGAKGDGAWIGTVPWEGLPQKIRPAEGFVVTANNQTVPNDHPYFIASDFENHYRAQRIEDMIRNSGGNLTLKDFQTMQADTVSLAARNITPRLLALMEAQSDEETEIFAALAAWDYRMDRHLTEPLIFHEWLRQLYPALYADELGRDLFETTHNHKAFFIDKVFNAAEGSRLTQWCDDISTDAAEDCAFVARAAYDAAIADLKARYGADWTSWLWGDAHIAFHQHQPFGHIPVLKNIFNRFIPANGGPYTVDRGNTSLSDEHPHLHLHGSVFRAIYDLDDLEKSVFVTSLGQSGNIFSPYYDSYIELWRDTDFVPMVTDPSVYERDAIGTLVLKPAP